jgi:hypothetical protein
MADAKRECPMCGEYMPAEANATRVPGLEAQRMVIRERLCRNDYFEEDE